MKKFTEKTFTRRQLHVLQTTKPGDPVRDIRLMRKLSKLGVAELHEQTGTIVRFWNNLIRAWYINKAEMFEVEGIGIFRAAFFDGCFCPFLIRAELDDTGRVKYY